MIPLCHLKTKMVSTKSTRSPMKHSLRKLPLQRSEKIKVRCSRRLPLQCGTSRSNSRSNSSSSNSNSNNKASVEVEVSAKMNTCNAGSNVTKSSSPTRIGKGKFSRRRLPLQHYRGRKVDNNSNRKLNDEDEGRCLDRFHEPVSYASPTRSCILSSHRWKDVSTDSAVSFADIIVQSFEYYNPASRHVCLSKCAVA